MTDLVELTRDQTFFDGATRFFFGSRLLDDVKGERSWLRTRT